MPKKTTADQSLALVQITAPDQAVAHRIANALVEQRLAAAVHIATITSVYRWQGAVERAPEVVLTAKTLAARFEEIAGLVDEIHPYALPPILQIDVTHTTPAYADWIVESAGGEGGSLI